MNWLKVEFFVSAEQDEASKIADQVGCALGDRYIDSMLIREVNEETVKNEVQVWAREP